MKLKATRRASGAPNPHNFLKPEQAALLRFFVPHQELYVITNNAQRGEEADYFRGKLKDLAELIEGMPKTYEQSNNADPTVYLHYFYGASDWYIIEKDRVSPGHEQTFGYAILNGDTQCAELGYISIQELLGISGMQLDLHWNPKPLSEIKAAKGCR